MTLYRLRRLAVLQSRHVKAMAHVTIKEKTSQIMIQYPKSFQVVKSGAIVRMRRFYVKMLAMTFRPNPHYGCHVRQTEQFRCLILKDCAAKFGVAARSQL